MIEKELPFLNRFYIYQKERFPFLAHGLLIAAFSFSAIAYSRICRQQEGFVALQHFLICAFNTVTLFFLVRIFDEFKDRDDDAKFRTYLPVPRGLITLNELKIAGIVVFLLQLIVNAVFVPQMLALYALVMGYLLLMSREFFAAEWLRRHQFWYVTSHMFIIPLVDIYASGFDWLLSDAEAPTGLLFFFAVSYMNGIVLEIGRKIKSPDAEEPGVLSFTFMLGTKRAPLVWLLVLFVTGVLAAAASFYAGHEMVTYIVLAALVVVCAIPAIMFLASTNKKNAKLIEYASAAWTFGMYLTLGGIPMLIRLLT